MSRRRRISLTEEERTALREVLDGSQELFYGLLLLKKTEHLNLAPLLLGVFGGEFLLSRRFDADMVTAVCRSGALPMALCTQHYPGSRDEYLLMIKLHERRCVVRWEDLRVHKSTKKKAKKFSVSIDKAFSRVLAKCIEHHGAGWLCPPLVEVFEQIHQQPDGVNGVTFHSMEVWVEDSEDSRMTEAEGEQREKAPIEAVSAAATLRSQGRSRARKVKAAPQTSTADGVKKAKISAADVVEEVEASSADVQAVGEGQKILVAGEIGYVVGGCYTSLSGFHSMNSSGSVQLAALAQLLQLSGFSLWDLGMEMDYKRDLGGRGLPRSEFLAVFKAEKEKERALPLKLEETNALELLRRPVERGPNAHE